MEVLNLHIASGGWVVQPVAPATSATPGILPQLSLKDSTFVEVRPRAEKLVLLITKAFLSYMKSTVVCFFPECGSKDSHAGLSPPTLTPQLQIMLVSTSFSPQGH